jgi:nucleotide sugar dehydrogenase
MANACVVGLGKIGLSLALVLSEAGHRVFGVDTNPRTLDRIRNQAWADTSIEKKLLGRFLDKCFFVTDDLHRGLAESEAVFIAIGTGIGSDGSPDLSSLFTLFENICSDSSQVRARLFVLKSTLPVGTTRKLVAIMEEKTKLQCGKDFFVAFCPERVLGDKAMSEMASLPKIIGGYDRMSSQKAASIYETVGGKIIIVASPEMAELIKLMDNAYRQTLFAFANDFALLAELYGVNAYELIKRANDHYPRNNIPFPSAGVGGYCLTKDPLYLEASFKEIASRRGFSSVWYSARKTNDYMPIHVISLLRSRLTSVGKTLKDSNVMICGITYKENTDDIRFSHGLEIARRLRDEGVGVLLWDPHVQERDLAYQIVTDPEQVLERLDGLIFTVKHSEFVQLNDDDSIVRMLCKMRTPVIVDGWGIFQRLIGRKDVLYAGLGLPTETQLGA